MPDPVSATATWATPALTSRCRRMFTVAPSWQLEGVGEQVVQDLFDPGAVSRHPRSEEHTSELQSPCNLVCRLLLEKKKNTYHNIHAIKLIGLPQHSDNDGKQDINRRKEEIEKPPKK